MRIGLAASIALVILSAAMAVAAFPPVSWRLLAPFAWIPLFAALQGKTARAGFRLGVLYGMLLYAGTLNWLFGLFGLQAIFLITILALFTGMAGSVAATLSLRNLSPWLAALLSAIMWTGCEYYRSEWFILRFPWITPGTALPPNVLTPLVGVYGASFVIVLVSSLIVARPRSAKISGAAGVIALSLIGIFRPGLVKPLNPLRVAAIQTEQGYLQACLRLTAEIPGTVDAIVWPEYAVSEDLRGNPEDLAKVRNMMADKGAGLLVLSNPVPLPSAEDRFENTAVSIGATEIFGTHVKNRPVTLMNDGVPGTAAPAIPTPLGMIATPICFDNDGEAVVRQAVRNGAELLLIPSMDSIDWSMRQHLQHAVFVPYRAAENHRWAVVSSTSGVTQIVDPHGNVSASLPLLQENTLVGDIARERVTTLYNRGGWLLGPVCTFGSAVLLSALMWQQLSHWIRKRLELRQIGS